ncbi:MAG: beta-mannanase-like protein [Solirubrobacterales bacterium]|nr:beta-mannanase-like protein [Solirubrobacterales bacterium]
MVQGGCARFVAYISAVFALWLVLAAQGHASTYWGATIAGETYGQTGPAPANTSAWNLFERHAGRKVAVLNTYQSWCQFDATTMNATQTRGAIPLVPMALGNGVTLADVVNGSQDTAIRNWAKAAKAWGHPFFFAPWWEMNGAWYSWGRSPDFVAAWRHFHDLVVQEGATNVTWTWVVNSIWSDPESDPTPYYPGDAYVDWTGLDSYNWGRDPAQPAHWTNPDQTFTPTLEIIKTVAPAKPIAIVENASTEIGGNKGDWIRELLTTYLPHHPEIKTNMWFNWNFPKNGFHSSWPIETSAPAEQAFRAGIQSSVYAEAPSSLPQLTKVPTAPLGTGEAPRPDDLSPAAEIASPPSLAVAPDGTTTVVWSARAGSSPGSSFEVFARRIASNGGPGAIQRLTATGEDALSPQVAVAPDGTATVAWIRSDGEHFLVQARRIAPDGGLDPSTKTLSSSGGNAMDPRLASGADGTSTVVWKRFDGFHYLIKERRISPGGTLEAESHTLSAGGQDAVEPRVAALPEGGATVVWSRFDGSQSIIQRRQIAPDGTPREATDDLSASEGSAVEPEVTAAPDGTATVVWDRFDGSHWIVQARRLSPAGTPLATTSLSASGGDAAEPQIAVGPDGSATVVWSRFDGTNFLAQIRRLAADGTAAPSPETLSAPGRGASGPEVAWSANDTLTTSWRRFNGAGDVVEAKTVLPPGDPPETPAAGVAQQPAAKSTVRAVVNNSFAIGRALLNLKAGTARLPITVPGPGRLELLGAIVRGRHIDTAGKAVLKVAAKPGKKRVLDRTGSVRLMVTVTFVPDGGQPSSQTKAVKLRRRAGTGL